MRWLGALFWALAAATPALAEIEPIPSAEDPRIGVIYYSSDQLIRLQSSPDNDLTILFGNGERVESVVVSDTSAFRVTVASAQDALFLHGLRPAANTSMVVRTNAHSYDIALVAAMNGTPPYLVRIAAGSQGAGRGLPKVWSPPVVTEPGRYKLSGNKALLPSSIRDDGAKVYIQWAAAQAIPAVFSIDNLGREEMVNGYMRDGAFTIDRVYDRLLFRIDKAEASARRLVGKTGKTK